MSSTIWFPGETAGVNENGVAVSSPEEESTVSVIKGEGVPDSVTEWTEIRNGSFYLNDTDLYVWDGTDWIGPYTVAV